jgi:dTDP-4-amino-4,6-dideoxygalactose transaminase
MERQYGSHARHQYMVRIRGNRRDEGRPKLSKAGTGTMVYYPVAVHRLPVCAGRYEALPEAAGAEGISLSIWPEIAEGRHIPLRCSGHASRKDTA